MSQNFTIIWFSRNVTPPMIKALLPRAPLAVNTILSDTTLELTCDAYTKAEADGRYLSSNNFAPLDARYFPRNPAVAEGNGIFHLVQEQFTPHFIRSLLFRPPLTGGAILGNGSVIEIEADCWSKAQSDGRYPLIATFNSLGSTVTSIDGRVTALEASPLPADISCTSLTASSFLETPELRGTPIVLRAIDSTPLVCCGRHHAGPGCHRQCGPHIERHHGGLRPAARWLCGGLGQRDHERQHPGRPADRE